MKERPIIFSAPMVQAILAGRKTQTRRLVKPAIECQHDWMFGPDGDGRLVGTPAAHIDDDSRDRVCPIAVGDRLWVKETWGLRRHFDITDWHRGSVRGEDKDHLLGEWVVEHLAEWQWYDDGRFDFVELDGAFWRTPLFMPRWASRITLEVTEVRAQRLQEITNEDVIAEGIRHDVSGRPWQAFADAWDRINGKRAPWSSSPWVWAYSFRRVA